MIREITIHISKTIIDGIITYHQRDNKLTAAQLQQSSIEEKTKDDLFLQIDHLLLIAIMVRFI